MAVVTARKCDEALGARHLVLRKIASQSHAHRVA